MRSTDADAVELILVSYIAGFFIAVPAMGPASAIIIRRILTGRIREGLAFAGGSTLAEGLACLAAVWGVELAIYTVPYFKTILQWGGIVILLGIGGYLLIRDPTGHPKADDIPEPGVAKLGGQVLVGFSITAFNPTLIATWTTVIGALVSVTGVDFAMWQRWTMPLAVMAGELSWFAVLLLLTKRFGARVEEWMIDWAIRGIGGVLVLVGLWSLARKIYLVI